ncbi:DDE-type integrase/transposase/recombinase [Neolewinella antarctica]|uniref:Transposase InsO family protein n=1 Tax=Neolewinella antarctica TaxID=442734 RepID=A0ABX0XH28_9BACT|nr:DDE-type integrase/transposase/recombinase [Neolewinella antarctica]NJC28507.1 transposase InsO family protein [Neolewinella antarctica]
MEQKNSFIRDHLSDEYYFSSLCESYGISRQSGYRLVRRYEAEGEDAFMDKSKRPLSSPGETSPEIVARIKYWRGFMKRCKFGAKKIHLRLTLEFDVERLPSLTTIHNILVREGLVVPRKKKRKVVAQHPRFDPTTSNEIWSIDHKGKFRLGNGRYCSPLTVCDSFSRFLFAAKGQYSENWRDTKQVLRSLFQQWGQPQHLHSDNGSAFASIQSPRGFGALSYWLLDHGILPVFSDPGSPGQNGRHERMHKDLKKECCNPPSINLRVQNRSMNRFKSVYNEIRGHESLDMRFPCDVHSRSATEYVDKVIDPVYGSELQTRKVCLNGAVRWKSHEWVTVCRALSGKYVGVLPLGNRVYEIYYRQECLGYFQQGEDIIKGHYYRLKSDRDLPHRYRDRGNRKRK